MSQMRKDIFTGSWVIVAETDTVRPSDFHFKRFVRETMFCPFCETNEAATPPEVFAIRSPGSSPNGPGWSVRVVPNANPLLRIEGELGRRAEGFHDLMNGVGAHEIIVETPRHDRSLHELEVHELSDVIRAYVARILDLEGDKRMRYVLIFKNHGEGAGAHSISHSISQLMALSVTPRSVKTRLMVARDYFALKERCLYCDVLQQELKGRRLIAENADFAAFAPFASRFPFEMGVLPKSHSSAFSRISPGQIENLARILRDVLQKLDHTLGGPPYNLSLQDRPFLRPRAGYWNTIEDDFHWYLQILPQIVRVTGFEWASWFFYNPVPPEIAAQCLSP
ncbi:MAG: galactose-1-phosphate uridylyltransferase [Candidatus Acidiferrales bacterium]